MRKARQQRGPRVRWRLIDLKRLARLREFIASWAFTGRRADRLPRAHPLAGPKNGQALPGR